MKIVLVGADLEENLGLGMIAACANASGHDVHVVPFDELGQVGEAGSRILAHRPDIVALGIQFQHRSHDFLTLAHRLRTAGYEGHVTCGGQFATMAWGEVLLCHAAVSSIVLFDGEQTFVELCDALVQGRALDTVAGLAIRGPGGRPMRTAPRPPTDDLNALPLPYRYRPHSLHLGIPFIPISGSRGCWGSCAFCAITTFYRDKNAYAGGKKLRLRAPEHLATEMAALWHRAAGPSIFCFHDDNFLLPRPDDSLARVAAIREALDGLGAGKAGLVGKCRPETLTPELARGLAALVVIRLYVGVENASQNGQDHLNRRTRTEQLRNALLALDEANIFGCYNLLVFEPDATLDDVRENIAFMREHAGHPVNFCRAEAYHGTPLYERLRKEGRLGGSFLGYDYRITDDRTELLFRICSAVFRERNFGPRGVTNRTMGLGYTAKVLDFFYDGASEEKKRLIRRADQLTRDVSAETAGFLEEALGMAERADLCANETVELATARLALKIAVHDRVWHVAFDELMSDMRAFVAARQEKRMPTAPPRKLRDAMSRLALASTVALAAPACGGTTQSSGTVADAGSDASSDGNIIKEQDVWVVDALPPDGGWYDPLPPDNSVDAGTKKDAAGDARPDIMVVDCLPPDGGWYDPLPSDLGASPSRPQSQLIDHWHDTSPTRAARTRDLPLYQPPTIALSAERVGNELRVRLTGGPAAITIRWQSERGDLPSDDQRDVHWSPTSDDDQLRVAVRTRGGVAVATLRPSEVPRKG
jgi:anaerobic magnesium-protoporphyrin IX monomethyl ester cyclase